MISTLKKQIKWEIGILVALVILALSACTSDTEFMLGGNDKTISIYNLKESFSLKLSSEESEKFISLINESDFQKIKYEEVDDSNYNEMSCVFLNKDSVVLCIIQSKDNNNAFCIKTHSEELADYDIAPVAYTFENEALSEFISELKDSASLPQGYAGEIVNIGKDNLDIILQSSDGQNIDLQGDWIFKTIMSEGSDDPNSKAMNYGLLSSCWGNAITLNNDGTGIMIYSYASETPILESVTWSYLYEEGRNSGIVYGNSGFSFIMKFKGMISSNPVFEMTDSTGSDDIYGENFVRTAELERMDTTSEIEHEAGITINDIHNIKVEYSGESQFIDSDDEIYLIANALKLIDISPAETAYNIEEKNYVFSLIGHDDTVAEIKMDESGMWLMISGICYQIEDPLVFQDAKSIVESHIDFSKGIGETDIKNIVGELSEIEISGAKASWSHFPQESYRAAHWDDEDFLDSWGYQEKKLSEEDTGYIFSILNEADYTLLENESTANTDFLIWLDFEDNSSLRLLADDSEAYMSLRYEGEWIYTKVLNSKLFEYLLGFADERGFALDVVSSAESVTICYVKDTDRKDYPENGMICEIEIADAKTVEKIAKAVVNESVRVMTHPSRENADIIFHTPEGDRYGKIKFPVSTNENGLSEPTIIMDGYYWYSCEDLYKILIEIENAQ